MFTRPQGSGKRDIYDRHTATGSVMSTRAEPGPSRWFLTAAERGNDATALDDRHAPGEAWSQGNLVRPLIHGASYFAELTSAVERMRAGDLLLFADWRGDPDQHLTGAHDAGVGGVLSQAARRGVLVRGLVWRSHWDDLGFSARENRRMDEEINQGGGCCLLDMRVRIGGSHHQKFVVLRHPGRPELDIAFVGGIDLCHSRRDDAAHHGDPQRQPMAKVYGERPPWHDAQVAVSGPAVSDVETVFRERWDDQQALSRSPIRLLADRRRGADRRPQRLPAPLPPPPPGGPHVVQLLRTYGRRAGGYPFAPDGERSVARGYLKVLSRARRLIYLEDQYLWSRDVGDKIAAALRAQPGLHLIAVLPHYPDQDGKLSLAPNLIGRLSALSVIRAAAPDRVAVYGAENHAGTPVYVHAKVCVIDDQWASVGSDNFNRRSWTHDSELSVAVWDTTLTDDGGRRYARDLRLTLAREHLDHDLEKTEPTAAFEAFARSAAALQAWHDGGRAGERPPGRLRPLQSSPPGRFTRAWATPLYRTIYDPDGRPPTWRRRGRY
jgi:phosphatidylserine/phosphatidylglycerophosphate/cardiolipin synthase-like enzyme